MEQILLFLQLWNALNIVLGSSWVQFGILVAGIANAVLLFLYYKETKRLADRTTEQVWSSRAQVEASNELVKDSKREFEPCIQILYEKCKIVIPILIYQFRGILLKNRNELHFIIRFKNLSKGKTYFKIVYNTSMDYSYLSMDPVVAAWGLELNYLRLGIYDYYLLKPYEEIEVPVVLRIIEGDDFDIDSIPNLPSGDLSIQYRIYYKKDVEQMEEIQETYDESWHFQIEEIRQYQSPRDHLLVGEWKGPYRHIIHQ